MNIADPHDMSRPSWKLYNRLLLLGVSVDEASDLMNGYAHELAEEIRTAADDEFPDGESNPQEFYGDWGSFYRDAADVIDPEVDDGDKQSASLVRPDEEPTP